MLSKQKTQQHPVAGRPIKGEYQGPLAQGVQLTWNKLYLSLSLNSQNKTLQHPDASKYLNTASIGIVASTAGKKERAPSKQ